MWPATVFAGRTFRLWRGACRRRAAVAAPRRAARDRKGGVGGMPAPRARRPVIGGKPVRVGPQPAHPTGRVDPCPHAHADERGQILTWPSPVIRARTHDVLYGPSSSWNPPSISLLPNGTPTTNSARACSQRAGDCSHGEMLSVVGRRERAMPKARDAGWPAASRPPHGLHASK